jgi:hypothetical protein
MKRVLLALALVAVAAGCGTTLDASRIESARREATGSESASLGEAPPAVDDDSSLRSGGDPSRIGSGAGTRSTTRTAGTVGPLTAARGPIRLGLLYAINDGAESAGVENGDTFSLEQTVHAFVESYNESGGIGGRRIEPVYAQLHSASNDYEAQAAAACATFTEDNRVAAVLSNLGYHSPGLLACLAKASVPMISGDWVGPDREDAARYPLFLTPVTMLGDTRVATVVSRLAASGFLAASNRVGVIIEDCPIDQRIFKNSLEPALKRAGLVLAGTYSPRCFQSLSDLGGQATDLAGAVLQFRRASVDRVMVVSQASEANIVFLFSQAADTQGYMPGYALSSVAVPTVLALNAPARQLANARGVGWLPAVDTVDQSQAPPTASGTRCLDRMRAKGLQPASNADYVDIYGVCDSFGFYDALLRATNGNAAPASVMPAIKAVVPTYVSASTVEGRVVLAADERHAFAGAGRLFGFTPGKGFEYISGSFPLG